MHDQPVRSGRTRHSSPSRQGSILHHHFWRTIAAEKKKKHTAVEGHFTDRTWKMCLEGGGKKKTWCGPWKSQYSLTVVKLTNLTLLWWIAYSCQVVNVWLRELKEGLCNVTFNTRGQRSCCPRHLSWEAGALDCLRAFFNLVLIAAAMSSNHFTSPGPLLLWPWGREFRGKKQNNFFTFYIQAKATWVTSASQDHHQSFLGFIGCSFI